MLVDGHSLAYRAFYAMPPLSTRQGQPVNAVLGFTNMLLRSIENERPTHLALSFDRGRSVARMEAYAEYKGGRDAMPEDLHAQIPVIEELVGAFGIPVFTSEAHEADDCIGTLARRAEADGFDEIVLISGDLDLLQLVDARTRVMATIRGITDTVRYDEKAVADRFGFPPDRIPDFKALAGDSSDNIPGVPGIGKGTASKLINQFGTVDSMLGRIDEIAPRWRERIAEQAERIRTYQSLATIDIEVPLEIDWTACEWTRVPASARDLLERLEFRRIVERLGLDREESRAAGQPGEPRPPVEMEPMGELAALQTRLQAAPLVGVAFVREGKATMELGLATDGDRGLALSLVAPPRETEQLLLEPVGDDGLDAARVTPLLAALGRPPGQAWTFDLKSALVEWPALLEGEAQWRDVGVASYLLESGESQKSLQAIAVRHGTRVPPEAEIVVGRGAKQVSWSTVEEAERAQFAAETAAATFELARVLPGRLEDDGLASLFLDVEMPLQSILARMERRGVKVDVPYLEALGREMHGELEEMRREIVALAGTEFNVNSPKQLGEVLFEHMRIPGGKRTKAGQYVTDAEILQKLAVDHAICARIMDYREVAKLLGTYVEALPRLVDRSGHVHTSWNGTVAATGRLSSSDPNLQNIPIRSALGRRIRRAFVPSRPGHLLLSADYSQIELRVMAHLSADPRLVAVFREGGDVHAATAAQVFGVAVGEVTADMRRKSKEVNFGILYGMGPDALAQRIGVSRKEAKEFIDRYLENFTGVRDMMRETVRSAEETGYVKTMLGRRRWLADIRSRNRMLKAAAERMATNAPIQGSAADLIKLAMVRLARELPEADMLLQVHDELVFEVAEGRCDALASSVREIMAGALPMEVPVVVDVKAGPTWAEMTELTLPVHR
jgi:DNA polymerase-1